MSMLRELLARTSRTFALAIPLLPEPTRTSVGLAYLLFRVADTLEDAAPWTCLERAHALSEYASLLRSTERERARAAGAASARWLARAPTSHEGYRALLSSLPEVLAAVDAMEGDASGLVVAHVLRTTEGMRAMLEERSGNVRDLPELRAYCYVVAGIVGEVLTELFVHDAPELARVKATLVQHQSAFGEGLQLVNILKDEIEDAGEGRCWLPPEVPRAQVAALARCDLAQARAYIAALEEGSAPRGFVAFTSLAAELADATLSRIERDGPGAKVPRSEVMGMLARFQSACR